MIINIKNNSSNNIEQWMKMSSTFFEFETKIFPISIAEMLQNLDIFAIFDLFPDFRLDFRLSMYRH